MWRHLDNWGRRFWRHIVKGRSIAATELSAGDSRSIMENGNSPISLLHEIFADRLYSRVLGKEDEWN